MGMFDYINCEYLLPDYPFLKEAEFQTKDLLCDMMRYTITKDGQLLGQVFCDNCGQHQPRKENSDYTGWMNFYHSFDISESFEKIDSLLYNERNNFYKEKNVRYLVDYNFRAEFFRGTLQQNQDESVVIIYDKNPDYKSREFYWIEREKIRIIDFLVKKKPA